MDVMQDIFSFVNAVKNGNNSIDFKKNLGRNHIRSISSFAGNSIYYFPILSSDNVSPKTLSMCAKAAERVYSTFVSATFSLIPTVNGDNVAEALKSIHQNMGMEQSLLSVALNEAAMKPYCNLPYNSINEAVTLDNSKDVNPKKFVADDYKKVTEMAPSIVNVKLKMSINGEVVDHSVSVGVKTTIHPLKSDELCGRIVDTVTGRGIVHDLIRWSTGEVISLKDIIFGIDKMKKNITKGADNEVNKWIDALRNRERLSELTLPTLAKKAFLPNTTVIITKSDAQNIYDAYGIDVLNTKYTRKLLKDNFLLGFMVVDDLTDTLHVLYDGHSNFETYHYNSVERDNAKHDKDMETLLKALGKMR